MKSQTKIQLTIGQRLAIVKECVEAAVDEKGIVIFRKVGSVTKVAERHGISRDRLNKMIDSYKKGKLSAEGNINLIREKEGKFAPVKHRLLAYIECRQRNYAFDICGLSWKLLQQKALDIAQSCLSEELYRNFKASSGWLHYVLKANNVVGVTLHGEKNEMNDDEAERIMATFRNELDAFLQLHEIDDLDRILNADQTGLYYQKLPNRIYCNKDLRNSIRGVKQMKDKNRITIMVCTAASGKKMPLLVVGSAKTPNCFALTKKLPCAYTNQDKSWFDRKVMLHWLSHVMAPACKAKFGSQNVVIILDNCSAHHGLEDKIHPAVLLASQHDCASTTC